MKKPWKDRFKKTPDLEAKDVDERLRDRTSKARKDLLDLHRKMKKERDF